jgi:hypothetical protein
MSLLVKSLRKPPTRATRLDVPQSFVSFVEWLGVELRPGQAELARVAFDGAEPLDRRLAERLFRDVPVGRRGVVAAVCGARAGKSYVLVALRLVHGMLVRDLSSLAPGQRAVALIIAPNDKLRREVANYALGAIQSKPELAAMLEGVSADGFGVRRPDGHLVRFETGVATAGGYGARGRSLTDFALDECAFFRDASAKVNDEEIYRAGSARVLPGGQTILASTPWAKAGLLHDFWAKRPEEVLVVHAPTLLLHDSPMTRELVEREMARDPDNAKREFGAEFMDAGGTLFFESSLIDAAQTDEPFALRHGDEVFAGGDFGFRSDSSALLMVARRGDMLHVFDGSEERPDGAPLKPSRTVASFAKRIAGRCGHLMSDGHYREAIAEHLEAHQLVYVPAPAQPAESYVRARMLMREGRVKIHALDFRDRLVQQMREVHGKPTSGGGMSIVHPRWASGGHGDLVAALVLALWQGSGDRVEAKPAPGTPEWELAEKRARYERFREEQERPAWKRPGAGAYWRR